MMTPSLVALIIIVAIGVSVGLVNGLRMSIDNTNNIIINKRAENSVTSRRDVFKKVSSAAAILSSSSSIAIEGGGRNNIANAASTDTDGKQMYYQQFPTLFDPLYGSSTIPKRSIKTQVGTNIWSIEQNLQLGPLQTPLRCVVVKLQNDDDEGGLWLHAPLAPTQEYFELVESCSTTGTVKHIVVPSYALEHKVFVKDALLRWPNAKLWVSPGQFSFPIRSVSNNYVFGKDVDGVLSTTSDDIMTYDNNDDKQQKKEQQQEQPPWINEIQYETLTAGTFNIAGKSTTFYETAFYHIASKSFIVTDAVTKISTAVPELNDPELLLLVSKRSTSDAQPEDTPKQRQIGWEKTALLVSYFFPQHEELDPNKLGAVTWTDGWHTNFERLSNRLIVPPVVRTLLYGQNPQRVKEWVDRVVHRWDFTQIIPAHFTAPVQATPYEFQRVFRFLDDGMVDTFPEEDLKRGLQPIADLVLGGNKKKPNT